MGGTNVKSHYEVLGVSPKAPHDEIRKAYLSAARQWHPDRHSSGGEKKAARAEAEMRLVNKAWEILGDKEGRDSYDQRLALTRRIAEAPPARPETDDEGITRIDPRLLDPEFLAERRRNQDDEISSRQAIPLRVMPLLAIVGLLAGIFVFTAYAESGSSAEPPAEESPPVGAGIETNDCVSETSGPALIEVPCARGVQRLTGSHLGDGSCDFPSSELVLSNNVVACLDLVE